MRPMRRPMRRAKPTVAPSERNRQLVASWGSLALGLGTVCLWLMSSCSGPERGQVVLGLVTDLQGPAALDNLRIRLFRSASATMEPSLVGDEIIPLDSEHTLPGSYAISADSSAWIRVEIEGRDRSNRTLVERSVVFLVETGTTRFLRLGLVEACLHRAACAKDQTCIEGVCDSPLVRAADLVPYGPDRETTLDCSGRTTFVSTATGRPIPVRGSCSSEQQCTEGSCRVGSP